MSAEVLVVADVADTLVTALASRVSPAAVSIKFPGATAMPANGHLLVLLTGGGGRRSTVLHDAQVTLEARAATAEKASALMALADGHMHALRFDEAAIYNVQSFGAPVDLPDPATGLPRYTATYQVTVRANAL